MNINIQQVMEKVFQWYAICISNYAIFQFFNWQMIHSWFWNIIYLIDN